MIEPSIRVLAADEVAGRHAALGAFERRFVYPLGADRFHIDHGDDYLAFFRRLGTPEMYVAEDGGHIVGVLVTVRRRIFGRDAWYLCDLKARAGARRLLAAFAAARVRDDTAAYGISMNPSGERNRLVDAARRCRAAAPLRTRALSLFTFDLEAWWRVEPILAASLGPIQFVDNRGVKDIVLESTGAPMPLLHAVHGSAAHGGRGPREGAAHMICIEAEHPLTPALAALGVQPTGMATLLLRNMDWFDPAAVSTSEV